jgi:hypothetical protein
MSAPRGHRAETGPGRVILADAFDLHDRPDVKDSPGQPCAAPLTTGESMSASRPRTPAGNGRRAPVGTDGGRAA